MKTESIAREYTVAYQLGAKGSSHRSFAAACKALAKASAAARKGGDRQGITIEVTEYKAGKLWGAGELTDDETATLAAI